MFQESESRAVREVLCCLYLEVGEGGFRVGGEALHLSLNPSRVQQFHQFVVSLKYTQETTTSVPDAGF